MKLLNNPIVVAALSILLSVGLGSMVIWKGAAAAIIANKAAHPVKHDEKEEEAKARGWDFWTIEIDNLSAELKEEKARMKKQSEQLDQRAARLAAEEKELGKVRAEIETMRKEIADKVVELSSDEMKNLRTLAQTYTSLTPKAAVTIFREMDDSTAVKILSLMKPDTVGLIFEEMSKTAGADGPLAKRAAVLSEKLRLLKAAKTASTP
jgi:flagellar motility protein MotE (MotC chaperone)